MVTKKARANELLEQYKAIFEVVLGKSCRLTFDMHDFSGVTVLGIELGKTTGMKNALDKRDDGAGKNRSPMIFNVLTDQGTLVFPFDDVIVAPITGGVRIRLPQAKPIGEREYMNVDLRAE